MTWKYRAFLEVAGMVVTWCIVAFCAVVYLQTTVGQVCEVLDNQYKSLIC